MKLHPLAKFSWLKSRTIKKHLIDADYLVQLSAEELEWYVAFLTLHYQGKGSRKKKRRGDITTRAFRESIDTIFPPHNSVTPELLLLAAEAEQRPRAGRRLAV
jgi:hypothetical protein